MSSRWLSSEASGLKEREIGEFNYAADTWEIERRVITRLEYGAQGTNPRFIVTNLDTEAAELYDRFYCQRGEAENRIKEAQLDLFGTRASCHKFLANQFRLLLAALAYTLMQQLRMLALHGSELANACAATVACAPVEDRRSHHPKHSPRAPDVRKPSPHARAIRNRRRTPRRAKPIA